MAAQTNGVPPVMLHQVQRIKVLPETVILLTVVIRHMPHASPDTMRVESLGQGFHRLIVEFGFMDAPCVPPMLARAAERFALPLAMDDVTYYLGRETFLATSKGQMGSWSEGLFAILSRNAKAATNHFGLPPEQVVEIGSQIDL
jgi:KUP system potassium uptake protein